MPSGAGPSPMCTTLRMAGTCPRNASAAGRKASSQRPWEGAKALPPGEDPWPAALRELREETNITSVARLGEIAEWLSYDIPPEIAGQAWNGKYRGQTQKWFALRFTGEESEIDIEHPAGGHEPEFIEWRWEPLQNLAALVVPFKRQTYERVVAEFAKFA